MNDLMRPSLCDAHHDIIPLADEGRAKEKVDVVGPICESGDFFAKERLLPKAEPGDFLAVMCAGAYGFSMASNYNSRRRPAEVLVNGSKVFEIRAREGYDDIIRNEKIPAGFK
jgi:diaminopimelate decarboxylase